MFENQNIFHFKKRKTLLCPMHSRILFLDMTLPTSVFVDREFYVSGAPPAGFISYRCSKVLSILSINASFAFQQHLLQKNCYPPGFFYKRRTPLLPNLQFRRHSVERAPSPVLKQNCSCEAMGGLFIAGLSVKVEEVVLPLGVQFGAEKRGWL